MAYDGSLEWAIDQIHALQKQLAVLKDRVDSQQKMLTEHSKTIAVLDRDAAQTEDQLTALMETMRRGG